MEKKQMIYNMTCIFFVIANFSVMTPFCFVVTYTTFHNINP